MAAMLSLRLKRFDKSLLHTINQEGCETEERGSQTCHCRSSTHLHTYMKFPDFVRDDPAGCLKDPRQQSTKLEKLKNINHEVCKTSKFIKNGCLSLFLHDMYLNTVAEIWKITNFDGFWYYQKKNTAISMNRLKQQIARIVSLGGENFSNLISSKRLSWNRMLHESRSVKL